MWTTSQSKPHVQREVVKGDNRMNLPSISPRDNRNKDYLNMLMTGDIAQENVYVHSIKAYGTV